MHSQSLASYAQRGPHAVTALEEGKSGACSGRYFIAIPVHPVHSVDMNEMRVPHLCLLTSRIGSSNGGSLIASRSRDSLLVLRIEPASLAQGGPSRRGELPTAGHGCGFGLELPAELP